MHSQFGQDEFVVDVLRGMRNGYFIESGAFDGIQGSNTLWLEKSFGWNGICIEPNDAEFLRLKKNRNCHCVNACLYDRETHIEFLENGRSGGGILSEYHPAQLEYVRSAYKVALNSSGIPITTTKATRTIGSILKEYEAPPIIDYWSLDTEGSEFSILRSFPFEQYAIRLLTIEHCWLPNRERIQTFLEKRGYLRINTLVIDDCYASSSHLSVPAWRSNVWGTR